MQYAVAGVYHLYFGDASRHPIISNYRRSLPELPQELVFVHVPDGRMARLWHLILAVIKKRKNTDWALHCHDVFSAVVGSILWKGRVIYDAHEIYSSFSKRRSISAFIAWLEKMAIRWSTIVVFPSKFRSEFYDLSNIDVRIVENLYYPYEDTDINAAQLIEPDWKESRTVFVYTGLFTPARAIDDIVAAFGDPRLSDCRLVLAGKRTEYLDSILEDAPPNVEYIGELGHSEIPNILRSAHAGFALYRPINENNRRCAPTKIFELLYFGVHVIASHSPYVMEIKGKTGSHLITALHVIDVESIVDACMTISATKSSVPSSVKNAVCWDSQMNIVRSLFM